MGFIAVDIRKNIDYYRIKREFENDLSFGKAYLRISQYRGGGGLKGACVLANVTIKIRGALVTLADIEKTFSMFGWIYNKRRNRLPAKRAA